nr:synaptobrevin, longin-like domain protein [Tanacetum cinerariifolium]
MARLAFCDYHNMVSILEKSEHNFWSTARIETTDEGTKILATVDGILRTVSESSIRRNLKLEDEERISTPTEPHHTPSPEAQPTSPTTHSSPTLPPVTTALIHTVTPSDTPHLRQYTRRAKIAQSSALLPVADELGSPLGDVIQGEACPTVSSLDAEQDRANITKTPTLPHESTSRSDLVSKFKAHELKITMLKARVKLLEDRERGVAERSGDDAPIKGRSLDEGEEVAKKGSNDTEEMINVLTSIDATTVLSSGVDEIPTGSSSIPTAGPPAVGVPTGSDVVPTAGQIFATATVFWSTARIETTDEGTKILATVDGILRTVSESSIRRNLKLEDEARISSLSDVKLFENLTLMGYNISPNKKFTFQKGQFSHQWKYLIHTIMQCLSPKSTGFNEFSSNIANALVFLATNRIYNFSKLFSMGEGSGTPIEPHHIPSPEAQPTSLTTHLSPTLPPVTTALIPTITPSDTPHLRQYTRRAKIAQSSALLPVADELGSPLGDVSQGEACPTISSLDAEQDMANITKTPTLPHESTSRSDLVSKFKAHELKITMLKARVKLLEDREGGVAERSGDDAPIKGRSLDEGEEVAKKGSNDTEEMINVLTSIDAAIVLSSGVDEVPTGSGSIPTAGPPAAGVPTGSDVVPTAGLIFATATVVTPYTRRKGKEKMIESETPKKKKIQEQMDIQMARQVEEEMERESQRMNEQIARDVEIVRIHAKEELQMMINSLDISNETVVKYLHEYEQIPKDLSIGERIELISNLVKYQENYAQVLKYPTLQRKPRSKKQKKDYYMAVIKGHAGWKTKDFKGMSFEQIKAKFNTVWKQIEDFIPIGSKEETKKFKRKGLRLEQVSENKLKTSKEVPEELKATEEVPKDKVKEMMQLVPVEEVYVEALKVKYPIIDWKVHIEGQRSYWKITRLGGSSA